MKKILKISVGISLILILGYLFSCQRENSTNLTPIYKDKTKPPVITNVKVDNISGGAIITYQIPADPSILYVQADFKINDKTVEQVKSSYYTDTLILKGFEKSADYEVKLHTVSRSEVASDSIKVMIHPLTPPYIAVAQSLKISGDFGGANVQFDNPSEGEIAIGTLVDTAGKPEYVYTSYTKDTKGNFSIRGFQAGERKYGAYVQDRWGNTSDTVWSTVKSLNEITLDRTLMKGVILSGDQTACCGSSIDVPLQNDYAAGDWAFYGVTNPGDSTPARITIDMGKPVVLSRFRYYMRKNGGAEFRNGTLRFFKVYGSLVPNSNGALDSTWTQIGGVYELVKPSGLPYGQLNSADQAEVNNGTEFIMPAPAVPMRYFRLVILQNFSGGHTLEMASIKFMGDYL